MKCDSTVSLSRFNFICLTNGRPHDRQRLLILLWTKHPVHDYKEESDFIISTNK